MPGHWLLGDGRHDGRGRERPSAVLLAVTSDADASSLTELARLADTDGLQVVGELTRQRSHPDPEPARRPLRDHLGRGMLVAVWRDAAGELPGTRVVGGALLP